MGDDNQRTDNGTTAGGRPEWDVEPVVEQIWGDLGGTVTRPITPRPPHAGRETAIHGAGALGVMVDVMKWSQIVPVPQIDTYTQLAAELGKRPHTNESVILDPVARSNEIW
jgi:hypothetical protein